MADVRALLRAERASRGSTTSKTQKPPTNTNPPPASSKKRKAADPKVAEIVKRLRAEEEDNDRPETSDDADHHEVPLKVKSSEKPSSRKQSIGSRVIAEPPADTRHPEDGDAIANSRQDAINEDEWAAFERDIADLESEPIQQTAPVTFNSTAVISAPAMTAEEVAARTERDKNQFKRREEELELEKEDAAAALQDEFDEIDRLEERARKVRDMREKIRQRQVKDDTERGEEAKDEPNWEDQDEEEDDIDDWYS